ncbi:WYL domain-containing protein [Ruminococcaceae bacterium OttesenSCG-928-A16]|nr:WYL domain-containing protein [Ruminococcaceae bacterium OttesenSCG-928-A16]
MALGSKKMLNIYILDILKEYSDVDHRLTQQDIIGHLRNDYEMDCERKAVSRNITALMEYGYDIVNDGGYYLESREFEDSEIRLLMDGVFFSPNIPVNQSRALIEKLRVLASPSFGKALHHVTSLSAIHDRQNKQFFYTLQTLDDAIGQKRKVALMVNAYGADMELHPRRKDKYIVNPYQLVAANGRYYLVGNHDNHDNVAHIRIDRITECEMLDIKAKPMALVKGLKNGISLPKYMAEHIYMRIGPSEMTRFRIHQDDIGEVIDWFGKDITVQKDTTKPGFLQISAVVNQSAMVHWTLQYLGMVEVLEPEGLRAEIKKMLHEASAAIDA